MRHRKPILVALALIVSLVLINSSWASGENSNVVTTEEAKLGLELPLSLHGVCGTPVHLPEGTIVESDGKIKKLTFPQNTYIERLDDGGLPVYRSTITKEDNVNYLKEETEWRCECDEGDPSRCGAHITFNPLTITCYEIQDCPNCVMIIG